MPVPFGGGGSSGSLAVNPRDLSNTAPTITNASKDIFEQELILDATTESVIGELKLLQSLAQFAQALQNFQERVNELMHCVGNEEGQVGQALEDAALAFNANENFTGDLFRELGPGPQVLPGLSPLLPKPAWPQITLPGITLPGVTPPVTTLPGITPPEILPFQEP